MDTKLSPAQERMLERLKKTGRENPPDGNRAAGRAASAWWRTARSLRDKGFLRLGRQATLLLHGPGF